MSAMSNLDLEVQLSFEQCEVKAVDYFPNGRGRRWLVTHQDDNCDTWSVGLIEKPNNTAAIRCSYSVFAYDPPVRGDMSDPHWVGDDHCSVEHKLIGHYSDFYSHNKVNDRLDDFSVTEERFGSPDQSMVRDIFVVLCGEDPQLS